MSGVALYADQPSTTVATGGTAALSQGASEQWTVGSSATFPPASVTAVPPTSFFVADTAVTTEIIQVTAVTSTVWGVTRGADSTTPVTHATGFTVRQVVTASGLNNFQQMRNGSLTAPTTVGASVTSGTMFTYTPAITDVPAAGVCYDFSGWGTCSFGGTVTTLFTIAVAFNGTTIATGTKGTNGTVPGSVTSASFWLEGRVSCYGATTMVSGFNFQTYGQAGTIGAVIGGCTGPTVITGSTAALSVLITTGALHTVKTIGALVHRIS